MSSSSRRNWLRGRWIIAVELCVLFIVATTLYLNHERLGVGNLLHYANNHNATPKPTAILDAETSQPTAVKPKLDGGKTEHVDTRPDVHPESSAAASTSVVKSKPTGSVTEYVDSRPDVLPVADVTAYVNAILDPSEASISRLECPKLNTIRYESLKNQTTTSDSTDGKEPQLAYFFAIDLRENLAVLPRLLGTVIEVIRFLGPDRCALSIVEGNSDDGTPQVLRALQSDHRLREMRLLRYNLTTTDVDPKTGDRIGALARLRNLALEPLLSDPRAGRATTVVFLNDVAACPEDVLELVLQRRAQGADMVCGLDWVYVGPDPTFYDVWIARTLSGNSFFDVPADGSWNSAWNIFFAPEDAEARTRYAERRPFQVFACWNGAAVFSAAPLLAGDGKVPGGTRGAGGAGSGLRFRKPMEGECPQGEPQLFCKDLWWMGYGKIAVVPTVHLEYSDEKARKIKELKGWTSALVGQGPPLGIPGQGEGGYKIDWKGPPDQVKCTPTWETQSWKPWNETLTGGPG